MLSCAFYARSLLAYLERNVLPSDYLIWGSFVLFALALLVIAMRVSPAGVLKVCALLALGLLTASRLEITVERMHLVKYGVMGILYSMDIIRKNRALGGGQATLVSVLFCALVAATDEACQHFIPDRVGDLRDVGFGALGGLWGALMGVCLERNRKIMPPASNLRNQP